MSVTFDVDPLFMSYLRGVCLTNRHNISAHEKSGQWSAARFFPYLSVVG